MRHLIIAIFSIAVMACDFNVMGPEIRATNHRFMDPVPETYFTWFKQVESCLGVQGSFERIRWFLADEITWNAIDAGGWINRPNRITMVTRYMHKAWMVRHEIVHYLRPDLSHDANGHLPCEHEDVTFQFK